MWAKNEKEYVAYLVGCLSKWFKLTLQVRAMHYSGRTLKYDMLAEPLDDTASQMMQFPYVVIEVKHHLADKGLKDITEAYMQAFEYRNTVVIDKRFEGTDKWNKRPPAVCLCSDYGRKWASRDIEHISRMLGRRGVYGMTADSNTVVAFTDHGPVCELSDWRKMIMELPKEPAACASDSALSMFIKMSAIEPIEDKAHTALRFASGISDWTGIQFLLSDQPGLRELTPMLLKQAMNDEPPMLPEEVIEREDGYDG